MILTADALKWDKVVLVGCDDESLLAMETAMILGPERIAGLILCGDLTEANRLAMETGGVPVLDNFLHSILDCPFVIVWDGGARSIVSGSSAHEAIESSSTYASSNGGRDGVDGRCVILGGGSAPHRTKPEYFAWVLARFVEEKLEYHNTEEGLTGSRNMMGSTRQNRGGILQYLNLPFGIDSVANPEGRLLLGRAIAAAIFYTCVLKVVVFQYGIIRLGLISIKSSIDSVGTLRRKVSQAIGAFILNFGYVPRLFKFSLKRAKELDEDDMGNSKVIGVESPVDQKPEVSLDKKDNESNKNYSESESPSTDPNEHDEEQEQEDKLRIKPLFFLDNIFT